MKSQEKRIARFIESLPSEGEVGKDQASLLVTGMGTMAATNGGSCVNEKKADCQYADNQDICKNYSGACSDATNRANCSSITPPSPPIIIPNNCTINSSLSC